MAPRRNPDRGGLAPGQPCQACVATCCRYVAVSLAPPRDQGKRDLIHWYLAHHGVCVYIDGDGDWWVQIGTDCQHRTAAGCRIYDNRPQICRDYSTQACESVEHDEENIAEFDTVEQFERFFELNFRGAGDTFRRRHRRYRAAAP